jgi:hypothetical protein
MVSTINTIFSFLLPIIVPLVLGGIGLVLDRTHFSDMFSTDFPVRSKAIGIIVNRLVFGLFSFDLWVIIAFAENSRVSFLSPSSSFSDKYAIAVFTLLLHLSTYIYTYTRVFIDSEKSLSNDDLTQHVKVLKFLGRDVRYILLFLISLALCFVIRM